MPPAQSVIVSNYDFIRLVLINGYVERAKKYFSKYSGTSIHADVRIVSPTH